MKFIPTLLLSILLTVTVGLLLRIPQKQAGGRLVSPLVAGVNTSENDSLYLPDSNNASWPVFVNNYYGYKIRHPSEVIIKNKRNGDISLIKSSSISISITQNVVSSNNTINTVIETDINQKKEDFPGEYFLEGIISPIALGQVTAYTYTAKEGSTVVSYFYIPQENNKYLLVANQSPHENTPDFLMSESIIYSLELIP